MSNTGISQNN